MKRILLTALLVFAAAACKHRPPEPLAPAPTPSAPPPPAAVVLPEPPPMPDLGPLAGRVVCLDPGHGGKWPGAVAPYNQLRESDVNLRVALRLREYLVGAGATVVMTRESDDAPDPSSLSRDLAARPALANSRNADVFVSIHHNADVTPDSQRNHLEVYYKLREDGPSLDLAQCLVQSLTLRLRADAEAKLLLPGNYKVLRESQRPSVLLESAYMTHSGYAAFLATGEAADREARAILAGLATYFAMDPPRVAGANVATDGEQRTHTVAVQLSAGAPLDPQSVTVTLDGDTRAGAVSVGDAAVYATFEEPLSNGQHAAVVKGRNVRGAAFLHAVPFTVDRPAARLAVRQHPLAPPRDSRIEVLFEVQPEDQFGFAVLNGTEVTLASPARRALVRGGKARFYLAPADTPDTLAFATKDALLPYTVAFGEEPWRTLTVSDARTEQAVARAIVFPETGAPIASTPDGWAAVPENARRINVTAAGYEPRAVELMDAHSTLMLQPVADGLFHGKRIVLDASYGGRRAGAISATGLRSSDLNRDVAERLGALLVAAGAEPILTRREDEELSELQRVSMADAAGASLYIAISHGAPRQEALVVNAAGRLDTPEAAYVAHYPGSEYGRMLAEAIAGSLGAHVRETVTYVVQQTASPAVLVQPRDTSLLPPLATPADLAAANRAVADAIFAGVRSYLEKTRTAK